MLALCKVFIEHINTLCEKKDQLKKFDTHSKYHIFFKYLQNSSDGTKVIFNECE